MFLLIKTAYNLVIYKNKYPLNPFFIKNQYPINLLIGIIIIELSSFSFYYSESKKDCQKHISSYVNSPGINFPEEIVNIIIKLGYKKSKK